MTHRQRRDRQTHLDSMLGQTKTAPRNIVRSQREGIWRTGLESRHLAQIHTTKLTPRNGHVMIDDEVHPEQVHGCLRPEAFGLLIVHAEPASNPWTGALITSDVRAVVRRFVIEEREDLFPAQLRVGYHNAAERTVVGDGKRGVGDRLWKLVEENEIGHGGGESEGGRPAWGAMGVVEGDEVREALDGRGFARRKGRCGVQRVERW